ncbi:YceI family protein [Streptomyces sp. NPDC047461]|uniref:YceI family protein n=1 Tax=Streptomyces sp. NPDC047461 TaxID=3155619 RepID=UPI0033C9B425
MPDDAPDARPSLRFELLDPPAVLTGAHIAPLDGGRHLQVTGDLELRGVAFPVLLRLRVVERTDDLLLVVGTVPMPYRLLRRATGFRLPWRRPATRLRLLVAAEFACAAESA